MNSQYFLKSLNIFSIQMLFQVIPVECTFKCTEFIPYTVDFADGNNRESPFLRLYDKFLQLK